MGTDITFLVVLHGIFFSLYEDSIVSLHCSFLLPFSRYFTDLWMRLTCAARAAPLAICHCFLNRFLRLISSKILAARGGRWLPRIRRLGADTVVASSMALVGSSTYLSVASSSFTAGFPGCLVFKASLECSPVSSREVGAVQKVLEG